ncbi:MAG: P-loop NTPase, partial [Thermoplasmata archaeon]
MYKCTSWSFNNTIPCFSFIYLTWQISYIFSKKYKTGILDLDLHGPSIPFILGINNIKIIESENGIFPVEWNTVNDSVLVSSSYFKAKGADELRMSRLTFKAVTILTFVTAIVFLAFVRFLVPAF